jgi:hypothetical protein
MRPHPLWSRLVIASLLFSVGCQSLDLDLKLPGMLNPENRRRDRVNKALKGEKGHSKLIGDYISIGGDTVRMIQGVGLVVGLDGTGEDPPATPQRKMLLEEMRRRKIDDPESLLASPNTALVVVTAYIPPLIRKGDLLDVEIKLPEGSQTTSLRGGQLMETFLREYAYLPEGGGVKEGREMALAHGPIMVRGGESDPSGLIQGVIPGGSKYISLERNLVIKLRDDYKGVKMATRIAERIGQRFNGYNSKGIKGPLAKAKTDQTIELVVHERYRDNYPRYLQAIRAIRLSETSIEHSLRLEELSKALVRGDSSAQAALELEAIGVETIPILKEGLEAESMEARFRAAEALAYLNDASGVDVLKEVADKEPAFRAFAIAAMSTLTDGDAILAMRELMQNESIETRYGALRALEIASPHDSAVITHKMEPGFDVKLVETAASPVVHLSRRRKPEIVLFGPDQRLEAPLVLRAGRDVLVRCAENSDRVKLTKIVPGQPQRELYSSLRVVEILAAAAELGVDYPAVEEMLMQAHKQHNMAGVLAYDQLPQAGRVYERPELAEGPGSETIGNPSMIPNLFDIDPSTLEVETEPEPDRPSESKAVEASEEEGMSGVSFGVK